MKTTLSWCPGELTRECDVLEGRLAKAIVDLLRDAAPQTVPSVCESLRILLDRHAVVHPEVFNWYFRLRTGALPVSVAIREFEALPAAIAESLRRADECERELGLRVDVSPYGEGVSEALKHGSQYAERIANERVHLDPLPELDADCKDRIKRATHLLGGVWPEVAAEIPRFVQKIIIYRGHQVIGFTDFRYHGSIFLKHEWLMKRPDVEAVCEDLVHEAAHVRLNSIMGATPLFRNDDREVYSSPLRQDLRSMYGVFHQMYVLLRVTEFYRRVRALGFLHVQERLAESCRGMLQAYEVVKRHADLTIAGKGLLSSIEAYLDGMHLGAKAQA